MVAFLSFSGPLTSVAKVSESKTCVSLNNQPCITRSTVIALKPCEKGFHYYTFLVQLDRCDVSWNTLELSILYQTGACNQKKYHKSFFFQSREKFSPEKRVFWFRLKNVINWLAQKFLTLTQWKKFLMLSWKNPKFLK